ncbi:MAG: hypothetical protein M3Y25_03060 [Thermoproteota archaeon]|nr:hypothetical protein [Thermoproteota archaeon]
MKELRTVFPYGLNDRCNGFDWTKKDVSKITASIFNKITVRRTHRGSRKTKWSKNFSVDQFLLELKEIYYDNETDWMFYCRKTIMSLSKKRLKSLATELFSKAWNNQDPFPYSIVEVLQDLIDFKLHFKLQPESESKPKVQSRVFMRIYFHNKGIEKVNLHQLMKNVKHSIPSTFNFKDLPRIIYKRSPTIARKIFNYKATVTNLDTNSWISTSVNCTCKDSKFCDPHLGHIMTGDLTIINNSKLRSLLCKGPKYREKERLNWNKTKSCIYDGIDDCVNYWAKFEKVDITQ